MNRRRAGKTIVRCDLPVATDKKRRKTHTSSKAQKSGEKLIPQMRHKKVEKNSYLK
jgi:hypothetical protein